MTIEYQLNKKDYIALLMYQTIKKQGKAIRAIILILATVFLIIGTLPVITNNSDKSSLIFIVVAAYLLLSHFYLKPLSWKKSFSKHIDNNMLDVFDSPIKISIEHNKLIEETFMGISKFNFDGLKELIELNNYLFLQLKNGGSIIFPKERINDFELNAFIDKIKDKTDILHSIESKRKLSY